MATTHDVEPQRQEAQELVCQAGLERDVLALLRRLDEESRVGALLILQAVERRVSM
jgi:hypothetical protein